MDRAILFRASDRSHKKVNFHRITRDKFAKKSANFTGTLRANFTEKQSVKTADFVVIFREKSLEIDQFCADQTSNNF